MIDNVKENRIKDVEDIPFTFGPMELCRILGVSKNTAYKLANSPGFPKILMGKRILISKELFLKWYDENFGTDYYFDSAINNAYTPIDKH